MSKNRHFIQLYHDANTEKKIFFHKILIRRQKKDVCNRGRMKKYDTIISSALLKTKTRKQGGCQCLHHFRFYSLILKQRNISH
ncbi:MAG: hypothetical protein COU47_03460 [Candidatus Niyogibacteria bacterium CG10_big_fil_rev_8_21_14_0_10_46_36]|uniref:Uncharacterized protein n=1 Tax=Candidatus Niyogibacteria bacterium CG10_big_fil_rev_8_21_14_0_10_46_36 TaxID=1974726 RepID=A0A2H0TCX4_9BACT|nr:MAG: hypothetical protein COU47_03460 [Candidatus Niyogibacteria bacterium CG10_big_fil_rev_8_21_14_0_10_46_36]